MDSPRRPPLRSDGRAVADLSCDGSVISRADSPYTDLESNYGCGAADAASTADGGGWGPPPIERCMSCISKLGAMSRSSTAATVVGGQGQSPATPCWEHHLHHLQQHQPQHHASSSACDRRSIGSSAGSSSSEGGGSSSSSGWSQAVTRPPARPPKPPGSPSPKKPPAVAPAGYDNYDVPKIPYPVEPRLDEHYDTPRKLKECLFETVHKPCGCIIRINKPEPERPCVCQRLMSCWSNQDDVQALYATVDFSKKCHRNSAQQQGNNANANYANIDVPMKNNAPPASNASTSSSNYENMDFAQSLKLYENGREVVQKAAGMCTKCGHSQDNYLMMEPASKPPGPHPGYIPMSPAVKQRLGKILSSSNPNLLTGPVLDRSTKPSGGSSATMIYQRKQLLDSMDNLDMRRRRSNSADSSSRCEDTVIEATSTTSSSCICSQQAVRRSSSVPCKANRDSSSSNDSGVFELPRRQASMIMSTLPRRSKSSDPLRDLSFQFQKPDGKSASAEAEVPVVCPSGSTSSGTSDMSDYIETLSLSSSHSSSDAVQPPPPSCTLRPRSGNEYLSLQRLIAPVPEERHHN